MRLALALIAVAALAAASAYTVARASTSGERPAPSAHDCRRAIGDIEYARELHDNTVRSYEENPGEERRLAPSLGDATWHRRWVFQYDRTLRVLETACYGTPPPGEGR